MILRKALLAPAFALLATGCVTTHEVQQDSPSVEPAQPKSAIEELQAISIEARHELRILAKAQEAQAQGSMTRAQHEQRFFQAVHVPKGFEKLATFHFSGKAVKAVAGIARIAGYDLSIEGKPVPNEPFVTIHQDNLPLNEALKELGVQTGSLIRIEIHEAANPPLIRFIYK